MPKFMLAKWKRDPTHRWFEYENPQILTLCDAPTIGVRREDLEPQFEVDAANRAEAQVKFDSGAAEFRYVHKGKCMFDPGLTVGDRNAIRRTTDRLLGLLSNEAVEFLLTAGGIVPGNNPDACRLQLAVKILGTT